MEPRRHCLIPCRSSAWGARGRSRPRCVEREQREGQACRSPQQTAQRAAHVAAEGFEQSPNVVFHPTILRLLRRSGCSIGLPKACQASAGTNSLILRPLRRGSHRADVPGPGQDIPYVGDASRLSILDAPSSAMDSWKNGKVRHMHLTEDSGKVVLLVTMRPEEAVRVISCRRATVSEREALFSETGYREGQSARVVHETLPENDAACATSTARTVLAGRRAGIRGRPHWALSPALSADSNRAGRDFTRLPFEHSVPPCATRNWLSGDSPTSGGTDR